MKQDFEDQMALKELILQAAKEEEETFKKAMLAKFAEDDRIELMNAQKQRMKQLEHKRAVEKLIEERRSQFLADKVRKALGSLVILIEQHPAHVFISKHLLREREKRGVRESLSVHMCTLVCSTGQPHIAPLLQFV